MHEGLVTTGGGREDDMRVGIGSGNGNEHGSKGLQSKLTLRVGIGSGNGNEHGSKGLQSKLTLII